MAFDASEMLRFAAEIETEARRVGREVAAALRQRGAQLQRVAQARAPRRTGTLADSIGVEYRGTGNSASISAIAGPTELYGKFQEFGTSKMSARPFMQPALDEVAPQFVADVDRIAGEAFR